MGLDFPVLYDQSAEVINAYLVFNRSNGYAVPSTFIVDTDGVVRWEFIGSTSHRTPSSEIIAQLKELS